MSLSVTQRPTVTIVDPTSGTLAGNWNAVANPIIYKLQSTDINHDSYRVEIEVYNGANVLLTAEPFAFTPNASGLITADISTILNAYLSPNNALTTGVQLDSNVYLRFYIKYREKWTGSSEAQSSDIANKFYVVLAGMQIPSQYGGNMGIYSAYDGATLLPKFLTKFSSPVMWRNYPFFLSLIVPENLTDDVEFYAAGATENDELGTPQDRSGNILAVNLGGADVEAEDSFDLHLRKNTGNVPVSETLTIEVRDACRNPVMLMARNNLGGIVQWLFEYTQSEEENFGNDKKNKRQVLTSNGLTYEQWRALHDFMTVGDVYQENIIEFTSSTIKTQSRIGQQVYVVEPDGTKTGVIVIPTVNKTDTKRRLHKFEIQIEYPEVLAP